MKKLLITLNLVLLLTSTCFAKDRIVWVAENNIEVTPSKTMTDVNGNSIEVWDEDKTKSYGQSGIDRELKAVKEKKKRLKERKADLTLIDIDIAKEDVKILRLQKIQAEMDTVLVKEVEIIK